MKNSNKSISAFMLIMMSLSSQASMKTNTIGSYFSLTKIHSIKSTDQETKLILSSNKHLYISHNFEKNELENIVIKKESKLGINNELGVYIDTVNKKYKILITGGYSPVDDALDHCLISKDYSSNWYLHCLKMAYNAWDLELNYAYDYLGGKSNKDLLNSQRAWLNYRDLTFSLFKVTIPRVATGLVNFEARKVEMIKTQTLLLSNLIKPYIY